MYVEQNYEGVNLEKLKIMVEAAQKKYITCKEGCLLYSLGRNTFVDLGARAGARRKIGAKVIYNVEKINEYIETMYGDADA